MPDIDGPGAQGSSVEAARGRSGAVHAGAESDEEQNGGGLFAATRPLHSVGFTLSSLGYAIGRRFREVLAPLQLEPREFALLRAVSFAEGHTQHATGLRLQIPPSRMVAIVDALEARGLLERRQNPADRRARALHLTRRGAKLLERALELANGFERELCADLTAQERDRLLELLHRVGARLDLPPGVHAANRDADEGC